MSKKSMVPKPKMDQFLIKCQLRIPIGHSVGIHAQKTRYLRETKGRNKGKKLVRMGKSRGKMRKKG